MAPGMAAFVATAIRANEVGAYEYYGRGLPLVGQIIVIHRVHGPDAGEATQGYVTRLNLDSNPPIAVTEVVATPHVGDVP